MLGYLLREQQVQQSNTRDNEHSVFPQGNHKWRKPRNFLRDRINTKIEKPKTLSDLLTVVTFFLYSPSVLSFLNYVLHLSVYVMYVK